MVVTASGAYLSWLNSSLGEQGPTELALVDLAAGRILARRNLGAVYLDLDQAVTADGSLWLTTMTSDHLSGQTLLRLNPATLAVEGHWSVEHAGGGAETFALAGGALWLAGGDRLLRFSPQQERVTLVVSLGDAASSWVAASESGDTLVVSEANSGGQGAVERRDPLSGKLLASAAVQGIAAPAVQLYNDSVVWVSESTGMLGYVQLLALGKLDSARAGCGEGPTSTCVRGTNSIYARVMANLLWVTDLPGGPATNYCADPSNGAVRMREPLGNPSKDRLLDAWQYLVFYASPGPRGDEYVEQEAIPSGCVLPRPRLDVCRDLALGLGPHVSGANEEDAILVTLTDRGSDTRDLLGYPSAELLTASGRSLPFSWTDERSRYVTSKPPGRVTLRPGQDSYVLVAKYACAVGGEAVAAVLRLVPPGTTEPHFLKLRSGLFDCCKGQLNTVALSPVEATVRRTVP